MTKELPNPLVAERLKQIQALSLKSGNRKGFEHGMCVMEAVSYVAGEPWSDSPYCACPVITVFMASWNDSLPNDAERDRLLKPLIPQIVGTRSTKAVEKRRSYMALDWLIRVQSANWLDMVPALAEHAKALRDLDEIVDMAGATAAGVKVRLASKDADAAGAIVGVIAWAAVGAVAQAAAWAAARASAWDDGAWDAARASARAAALATVWATAWAPLAPTKEWLQASALELVGRMIAVKSN